MSEAQKFQLALVAAYAVAVAVLLLDLFVWRPN